MKYKLVQAKVVAATFHGHKNEKYLQRLITTLTLDLNINDEFNLGLGYSLFIETESGTDIGSLEVAFMYEVNLPHPRGANSFLPVLLDSFSEFEEHYRTTSKIHFEKLVITPPDYQNLISQIRDGLLSLSN